MRSYLGKLTLLSVGGYQFWPDRQDEPIALDGDYDHIPVSVPLEVMIEGGEIVEWHRDFSKAGYRDKTRKHIALCLMTTESRKESLTQTAEKTRTNMLNALRWSCPAFDTEIQVYPLVVENPRDYGLNGPWTPTRNQAGIKDMMEGMYPDFNPIYYHVIGGGSVNGLSGISSVNGWNSATFNPINWTTSVHEQLHAYGLHHHSTATAEYGGDSWMGRSNVGWGITAPDYHYLGLIGPENIGRIGTDSFYAHLVAPEVDDQGMAPGERKIIYFRSNDKDYALWVRGNKVRVSQSPMSRLDYQGNSGRTRYVTELAQGDRWETLRVDYVGRGVARVQINGGFQTSPSELSIPDEVSPITDGHFHDTGKTHQGIQVYRDPTGMEQTVVYWFTWDDTGPTFMVAQGEIEDEVAYLTIYHTPDKVLTEVGEAVLYFRDDDNVTMKYRLTLKDKWWPGPGVLQLTRLTNPDSVDAWETGEREGVTRQVLGDRELVMRWYQDFDHRTYRPRWLYGEDGILYEPFGGVANIRADSGIQRWGQYEIGAKFRYKRDGWADWQSKPLVRLI